MPNFDVITIDLNQLNKVKLKKQDILNSQGLDSNSIENPNIEDFHNWRVYISKTIRDSRITATRIVHI